MKQKKAPMRKCVGCMKSKAKRELIRLIVDGEGSLLIDTTGKANGRGVYLCPDSACFHLARKKRAVGRSLDMTFSEEALDRVFEELQKYEKENL